MKKVRPRIAAHSRFSGRLDAFPEEPSAMGTDRKGDSCLEFNTLPKTYATVYSIDKVAYIQYTSIMTYNATAVKIVIASPSDVPNERRIIRNVLSEWNNINAESSKVVLMPVGWETHSSPLMGSRPQQIINEQVLENSDVLIAVFWTRIGTPTGEAASGTIEEIQRHVDAGKPTMIYFSSAPVRPDSVDTEQFQLIKEFKSWCYEKGLVEGYETPEEFKEKLFRQVSQTVLRLYSSNQAVAIKASSSNVNNILKKSAKILLKAASMDPGGSVMRIETMGGLFIQSNDLSFAEQGNPRSEAQWEGALNQLISFGFVSQVSRGCLTRF